MILMYHKVDLVAHTEWWVTVDSFFRQMWELQQYKVVYLSNYDPKDDSHVVISFDGVYSNILKFAAPIMHHFGYPFELFVVGDTIGVLDYDDNGEPCSPFCDLNELNKLIEMGGRLQWHSRSHPNFIDICDDIIIQNELKIPGVLRELDPNGFSWFAYPYGNYTDLAIHHVSAIFAGAVSCTQGSDEDRYRLRRITANESIKFKNKHISCVIACYNYGEFLVDAVESVLRQSILPDEILISDDCSSDSTKEIAADYVKRYPKLIRYNRNEINLGIVEHFNKAVRLTSGEIVFILGADNKIPSNYIEECAAILLQSVSKGIGIVYTDFELFGNRAKLIYESYPKSQQGGSHDGFYRVVFPKSSDCAKEAAVRSNFIHGSSMYLRAAFEAVGGYIAKTDRPEDYDLFFRMLEIGYKAVKCEKTWLEYRQHSKEQANVKFISALTLLHYIEKSRRLEAELRLVERSFWRKALFPVFFLYRQLIRIYKILLNNNFLQIVEKIKRKYYHEK